jgi:hypothetical protein
LAKGQALWMSFSGTHESLARSDRVRKIGFANNSAPAGEQVKIIDQRIEYLQRRRKELEMLLSQGHLPGKPLVSRVVSRDVSRLHGDGHAELATRLSR